MRRLVPVLVLVLLVAAVAVWRLTRAVPVPRHVVVISLDTLRADHLGSYGAIDVATPRLDALAREAVRFDQAITAAPSTLASHTSLFTGLWPHTHGVPRNDHRVNPANTLLQERLGDLGFQTAAFLGAIPLGSHSGFTQGFDHVDERFTLDRNRHAVAQSMRTGTEVTDAALAWLADRDGDAPVFLFAHYFDVHAPYTPPEPFRSAHAPATDAPHLGTMDHVRSVRARLRGRRDATLTADVAALERLYAGGVAYADHEVGRLLDGLASEGILDDALVIVTSDHGETFATHPEEVFDHGFSVFDATIRVPLLVRLPRAWGGGAVVQDQVSHVDLVPTLVELLALAPEPEGSLDGVSYLPQLRGDWIRAARPPAFAEATKPHVRHRHAWLNDPMQKAVRHDGMKLVLRPRAGTERLYDLSDDPGEQSPISDRPDDRTRLRELLERWRAQADPHESPRISAARIKQELAALGYTEALEDDDGSPADSDAEE